MQRYPGFVGPSATSRSKIACADRTVNLYVEKNESGTATAPYTMYRVPGYQEWCDFGIDDPVRGSFTLNGSAYAVAGDTLYLLPLTLGGTPTELADGINNPDDSPVSIAGNGDGGFQLVIAAAGVLYVYDITAGTLTEIPDIAATQVLFMDATFFALDPNSSTLYASAPEDGSSWDPLDVAQRTSAADKIIAFARVGTEVWTFGAQTTTPWYNAGNTDFPLTPNPSIFIQRGINAPWSVVVADGSPIWLGNGIDGGLTVYRGQGYTPQRISTSAVEYAIGQYTATTDAEAQIYQEEGHQFYVLKFPTENKMWVYDITQGLWHERGEYNGTDYDAFPIRSHVYVNGVHLVGSAADGVMLQQSLELATNTDGTSGIRWVRRAPHLCEDKRRNTYAHLRVLAQVGVGLPSGQGSEPVVALRYSDDGAQSFGDVEWASLGEMGQYAALLEWWMLGQGDDRVFEIYGSDPVVTALTDAYLEIRPGTS